LNDLTTTITQNVVVSFQAPENLVVTIENDAAVSKQVNVMATADFATSYEVDFGETGVEPIAGNIDETISHIYQDPGTYTISVTAMSAAIATTVYTEEFEVTAIVQPLASAPMPPARADGDVISIYSAAYNDLPDTNYFPDWGQGGQGSGWATFDLNGDEMLQYINLSYQGIALADGTLVDVSGMEFLHLDVWTADVVTDIETSLINNAGGTVTEAPIVSSLAADSWTSIEIPISDYTDQGLTVTEIFQLKFVGTPWAAGTVFIDNIYFYKQGTDCELETTENIDPANGNIDWTFMTNDFAHSFEAFGDISSTIVDNPVPDDVNSSCLVQEYIKTPGCQTWSGVGKGLTNAIDLVNNNDRMFSMKVFAVDHTTEVTLRLEFEPFPNVDPAVDVVQTISQVGQWEELIFDFSEHTDKTFKSIIVYFDRNNACDGATYYFDDIKQFGAGGADILNLPVDFESSTLNYDWSGFGDSGFGPIPVEVIANPDQSGINTSATVLEVNKTAGAQVWAGAAMSLDGTLDFSNGTTVKLKVWSPIAGANFLFKIEDSTSPPDGNGNPTVFAEVQATVSAANAWEEISFDLTSFGAFSTSINYDTIIVFPNFGAMGNDNLYYFDDIILTN